MFDHCWNLFEILPRSSCTLHIIYYIYRILHTSVYPIRYTTCVSKLEMGFGYYLSTSYVKQPTMQDFAAFRIGDVQ